MSDKGSRGGKYPKINASGYYGRNDAGTPRIMGQGGIPTKREFVGSPSEEYIFSSEKQGTRIIVARSYEEALRIAESLGFTQGHYKKKRKYK